MRKILSFTVLLALLVGFIVAISGCKTQALTAAVDYAQKHCPKTEIINPLTGKLEIHYRCDSLWPTSPVDNHCSQVEFCVDAATGSLYGVIQCDELIPKNVLRKKAGK